MEYIKSAASTGYGWGRGFLQYVGVVGQDAQPAQQPGTELGTVNESKKADAGDAKSTDTSLNDRKVETPVEVAVVRFHMAAEDADADSKEATASLSNSSTVTVVTEKPVVAKVRPPVAKAKSYRERARDSVTHIAIAARTPVTVHEVKCSCACVMFVLSLVMIVVGGALSGKGSSQTGAKVPNSETREKTQLEKDLYAWGSAMYSIGIFIFVLLVCLWCCDSGNRNRREGISLGRLARAVV